MSSQNSTHLNTTQHMSKSEPTICESKVQKQAAQQSLPFLVPDGTDPPVTPSDYTLPPSVQARVTSKEPYWKNKSGSSQTSDANSDFKANYVPPKHLAETSINNEVVSPTSSAPVDQATSSAETLGSIGQGIKRSWHTNSEWLWLTKILSRFHRRIALANEGNGAQGTQTGSRRGGDDSGGRRKRVNSVFKKETESLTKVADDIGYEYLVLAWKWATDDTELLAAQFACHAANETFRRDGSASNLVNLKEALWHHCQALFNWSLARSQDAGTGDVMKFASSMAAQWVSFPNMPESKTNIIERLLTAVLKRATWLSQPEILNWGGSSIQRMRVQPWFGEP